MSGRPKRVRFIDSARLSVTLAVVSAILGYSYLLLFATIAPLPIAAFAAMAGLGVLASAALLLREEWVVHIGPAVVVIAAISPAASVTVWTVAYLTGYNSSKSRALTTGVAALLASLLSLAAYQSVSTFQVSYLSLMQVGALGLFMISSACITGIAIGGRARRAATTEHDLKLSLSTAHEAMLTSRRDEREQLAREMHDVVGHRLALMRIYTEVLTQTSLRDDERAHAAHVIETNVAGAIKDLRNVLSLLHQDDTQSAEAEHYAETIGHIFDGFTDAGMNLSATVSGEIAELSPMHQRTLERFCREGLTNALKYAGPGEVNVLIRSDRGTTRATVSSPLGKNFSPRGRLHSGGRGLSGLYARVALLGGETSLKVASGRFELFMVLPAKFLDNDDERA